MPVRTLKSGMAGADVKAVQDALNVWGAKPQLDPNGKFGSTTEQAVKQFQGAKSLKPDGIIGHDTRRALFPIGVATTTVYGMRLQMPQPPRFHANTPQLAATLKMFPPPASLTPALYKPTRFPRLVYPIAAPEIPDWKLTIQPLPGQPPSAPFGFEYDHGELVPGGQSTWPFGHARQDVFVLTIQNVYRRGPDDGAHREFTEGVQVGASVVDPNGEWTFNPFVQLTDVDRLGALGAFHYWQPYAQAGVADTGPGKPQPMLTGNLFPVNLGFDATNSLTVTFAAGLAATLDLLTGQLVAGPQLTFGITFKHGKPPEKTPKPTDSPAVLPGPRIQH